MGTLSPHRDSVVTPLTVVELDAHRDQLEQTVEVMRPLQVLAGECAFHARVDLPNYFRANQAIHQRLVEQCGNPYPHGDL